MDALLEEAIDALFRVFEGYPLRRSTEPCTCCHEPDEERVLHERLLPELSADDLRGFAGDALTVWGNEVDFKHFLPRIMEITVTAGGSDWRRQDWIEWPDTESIFERLAYGTWHEWPELEQQAVARFLLGLGHRLSAR